MKCVNCGCKMVWQNDYDFNDYGINGEGIIKVFSCGECDTLSENFIPLKEEEQ